MLTVRNIDSSKDILVSLHHDTASPTTRLVGNTGSANRQLVGKDYWWLTLSVGESPDGKTLSRPTYLSRPTVCRLWCIFPDQHSVGPTMGLSRPTVCWGYHGPIPTDYQTRNSFPTNNLLGCHGPFPTDNLTVYSFPTNIMLGLALAFLINC